MSEDRPVIVPRAGRGRRKGLDDQPLEQPRKQGAKIKAFGAEIEITGSNTIIVLLFILGGANSVLLWIEVGQLERLAVAVEQSASASRMLGCMVGSDPQQSRKDRYEECLRILGRQT